MAPDVVLEVVAVCPDGTKISIPPAKANNQGNIHLFWEVPDSVGLGAGSFQWRASYNGSYFSDGIAQWERPTSFEMVFEDIDLANIPSAESSLPRWLYLTWSFAAGQQATAVWVDRPGSPPRDMAVHYGHGLDWEEFRQLRIERRLPEPDHRLRGVAVDEGVFVCTWHIPEDTPAGPGVVAPTSSRPGHYFHDFYFETQPASEAVSLPINAVVAGCESSYTHNEDGSLLYSVEAGREARAVVLTSPGASVEGTVGFLAEDEKRHTVHLDTQIAGPEGVVVWSFSVPSPQTICTSTTGLARTTTYRAVFTATKDGIEASESIEGGVIPPQIRATGSLSGGAVEPGASVLLWAKGISGVEYSAALYYDSDGEEQGFEESSLIFSPQTPAPHGGFGDEIVQWTWDVPQDVALGEWWLAITASVGGFDATSTVYFTVPSEVQELTGTDEEEDEETAGEGGASIELHIWTSLSQSPRFAYSPNFRDVFVTSPVEPDGTANVLVTLNEGKGQRVGATIVLGDSSIQLPSKLTDSQGKVSWSWPETTVQQGYVMVTVSRGGYLDWYYAKTLFEVK